MINELDQAYAESIVILREVGEEFERMVRGMIDTVSISSIPVLEELGIPVLEELKLEGRVIEDEASVVALEVEGVTVEQETMMEEKVLELVELDEIEVVEAEVMEVIEEVEMVLQSVVEVEL